jgi:hypothetical protein
MRSNKIENKIFFILYRILSLVSSLLYENSLYVSLRLTLINGRFFITKLLITSLIYKINAL